MVNGVHRFTNAVRPRINASKTKVLSAQANSWSRGTITLDCVLFEEVPSFKYLGASLTVTGQAVGEIAAKINLARATFNRLHTSLCSRHESSRRTQGRIYK